MANIIDQTNLVNKSINLLQDVDTTTSSPVLGDIIKFDGSNWFTNQETSLLTTNRETLTADKEMVIGDDVRQYLDPGDEGRYLTLPDPAIAGMFYIIKNLNGSKRLLVRETTTGPNILTLSTDAGILESYFIYDGTEWHGQGPGTILEPIIFDIGFTQMIEANIVEPAPLPITIGFTGMIEDNIVAPLPLPVATGFTQMTEANIVEPLV